MRKVVAAIENAGDGDNCDADIQAFRQYLDEENKGKGVIKTGKHFNMQLLVDAFTLYDEKYHQFGGRNDSPKNVLFFYKIIGYIERYLPACYAQAICQNVYDIIQRKKALKRGLTFPHSPDVTFYPLDSNLGFRLGDEFAVRGGGLYGARLADWIRFLQTYVQQKTSMAGRFIRPQPTHYPESCRLVR